MFINLAQTIQTTQGLQTTVESFITKCQENIDKLLKLCQTIAQFQQQNQNKLSEELIKEILELQFKDQNTLAPNKMPFMIAQLIKWRDLEQSIYNLQKKYKWFELVKQAVLSLPNEDDRKAKMLTMIKFAKTQQPPTLPEGGTNNVKLNNLISTIGALQKKLKKQNSSIEDSFNVAMEILQSPSEIMGI